MRSSLRMWMLCAMSAVLTAGASAQRTHDEALLAERDREILHTAEDPLVLRGIDQGPDGFRSGTPALQRADVSVAMVDADELRRRRLSMYAGGATIDAPLATRVFDAGAAPAPAAAATAPDEPREEPESHPGRYAFIGVFAIAGGLAASFFLRRR